MAMLAKAAPSVAMSELIPGSPQVDQQQHLPTNVASRYKVQSNDEDILKYKYGELVI